jgi:CBS domain-containing protein
MILVTSVGTVRGAVRLMIEHDFSQLSVVNEREIGKITQSLLCAVRPRSLSPFEPAIEFLAGDREDDRSPVWAGVGIF